MGLESISKGNLMQFIGTEHYWSVMGHNVTDGIKFLMENGASWLVTDIIGWQCDSKVKGKSFQIWRLEVKDNKGVLTMREDSNMPVVIRKEYSYTDFPLDEIEIWVVDGIMLLPSEY